MCIVSDSKKFVFVHIPKTAGGSIRIAMTEVGQGYQPRGFFQHAPAVSLCNANPKLWNEYLTFAFVRNPWARLWSMYNFVLGRSGPDNPELGSNFDDFLMNKKKVHRWAANFPNPNTPFQRRPQSDWLCDLNGELMVDFIGRFESLETSLDTLYGKLNIPRQKLIRSHQSKSARDYRQAYTDESKEFVAEYFKSDIELFGYTFEN